MNKTDTCIPYMIYSFVHIFLHIHFHIKENITYISGEIYL